MKTLRVWSLWEIMNLFDVCFLATVLHSLGQVELGLLLPKIGGQGSQRVPENVNTRMIKALAEAKLLFEVNGLKDCLKSVGFAKHSWERPLLDISSACEITHRLQVDILGALHDRQFLRIEDDRLHLIPHTEGDRVCGGILDVIGPQIMVAFPSAVADFLEAGNCLVAECNTAAVFHLMRVAEVGLRAIASDRKASFSNKPLDQQQWGAILQYLDGTLKDLRASPSSKWSDPGVRDVQTRFYGEVVAELRGFNEAWRRHLSHAREDAIYGHDYATSVFTHVLKFMKKLATKISETTTTLEYWDTE